MIQQQFQLYFLYTVSDGVVFYIGITKRSLKARMASHIFDAKAKRSDGVWKVHNYRANKLRSLLTSNTPFAIEGLLSFATEAEAQEAEKKYIAWCKQMNWKLVNATEGGEGTQGYKHSETTKSKLRELNSGSKNPQFGKSPSEETRAKQRESLLGKPNPGLLDPIKKAQWQANVKAGHSDVSGERNPMFGTTGARNAKSKLVIQLNMAGEKLRVFDGLRDAERQTSIRSGAISLCCNEKRQTAGGFRWKFAE